ncbi:MAG: class I SAM-dependent RNA methyltransferase [Chloroflexota bacterium]|nr:class I SAM-dependent RNA methyltransferase [Chloroflexota bacterium]
MSAEPPHTPEDLTELHLTGIAHGGKSVARQDGRVVFVPFGIPGETVQAEIYRRRKRFAEAEIRRVIEASLDRVTPRCPYFGECGGCQLQHVAYDRQLELKRQVVADLLQRIGGFRDVAVHPTVPSPHQYGYRNSARFLGGRRGDLGYTDWRSNTFMRVDTCPIMSEPISEALRELQGHSRMGEALRVRYSELDDAVAVWPAIEAPISTGQQGLRHGLLGEAFYVSSTAFFQVNTLQAENLIRLALEGLRPLEGKTVLDAYYGGGAFTRFLAVEAAQTIGIEESTSAIADARTNLAGLRVSLIEGRTEDELPRLLERIDLVLLDPPRTGCELPALEALLTLMPEKIVYVSCDPATLARDLKVLCSAGAYTVSGVQPVDMFPQTYHIEAVATLHAL